jgi:predicted aminopeptidase
MDGVDNEKLLKDPRVKKEHKEKLRRIKKYKKYFYDYFKEDLTDIYEETVFLKRDAVTYLVIASPHFDVKPREECFIIMGCFPYLGFFNLNKAKEYAQGLEEKEFVTFIRPVTAYSTLGYFDDNVLSTFFRYKEKELANLIFHELFHTIFFAKGEVELNENLAMFFADELERMYFSYNNDDLEKIALKKKKRHKVNLFIVNAVKRLKKQYDASTDKSKEATSRVLDNFMKNDFIPKGRELCHIMGLQSCSFIKKQWNNASFSAFLTYEKKSDEIRSLYKSLNVSLVDFYKYIEAKYKKYRKKGLNMSFSSYLLEKK